MSLKGKKSKRWTYGKVELYCDICGKKFESTPSQIKNGRKYCSSGCSRVGSHKEIVKKCIVCNKSFTVTPSKERRGVGKCCSKACMGVLFQSLKQGEGNPMWLGGKSFEPYCHKFNDELKEYVRDKFGRQCFICGSPENGRKLSVHHVDYNKLQGCKGKTWTLIPLCNSCHPKTNRNRSHWFNLLINYWALNPEINLHDDHLIP